MVTTVNDTVFYVKKVRRAWVYNAYYMVNNVKLWEVVDVNQILENIL